MTDLEKVRDWLKAFPGTEARQGMPDEFTIDHVSESPFKAGLNSDGTIEVSRRQDISGNITVTKQYSFSLCVVMEKDPSADEISAQNAEWVMAFQEWVSEQSIKKLCPTFGNIDTDSEKILAQNGSFVRRVSDGAGMYMTTITALFKKYYKGE